MQLISLCIDPSLDGPNEMGEKRHKYAICVEYMRVSMSNLQFLRCLHKFIKNQQLSTTWDEKYSYAYLYLKRPDKKVEAIKRPTSYSKESDEIDKLDDKENDSEDSPLIKGSNTHKDNGEA